MWTGSKNMRFRSRTLWRSANMTHFWQEDFVPDELKKKGVSLEQEVKTWDPDLEHNGEVQIWQTI